MELHHRVNKKELIKPTLRLMYDLKPHASLSGYSQVFIEWYRIRVQIAD